MLGDARTGAAQPVLTEHDSAWVDVVNDLRWLDGGKSLHVDERARRMAASLRRVARREVGAARHARRVRRAQSGEPVRRDERARRGRARRARSTSPRRRTNPTQLYLYRAPLDGSSAEQRVTPANEPGTHGYGIAPSGRFAMHTYSTFGVPPMTELVRLPSHEVVRTLVDNARAARRAWPPAARAGGVLPRRRRQRVLRSTAG